MALCCSGCNMTGSGSTSPLRAALSCSFANNKNFKYFGMEEVVCIGLVAPLSRACLLLPTCTSWKPQAWKPAHCTHSFRLRHEPRKSSQQKTEALARVPADEARLNPSLIAKETYGIQYKDAKVSI
ncbi:hypothetical protein TRIUR3_07066 [Triticum urartu]|uniref:Uncharacterized protein n=1 Tax=Triticum urartu TaxID=4572 RepID=M8AAT1_TRIUA|nr:hypothetical protein TRIUR3_07066 [Triticum urartu]